MYLKRGLSSLDTRRAFTANASYELPFGRQLTGAAGAIGKGWQLNSVITLSDGYPLSVRELSAAQIARIGDDEDIRPDLIPGGKTNPVTGDPNRYFDLSQFRPARIGYFGNLGRNTVISPGLGNVDLSIFKNTDIESSRIQFRIEMFNLFNRSNFANPEMTAFIDEQPNPTAGLITRTRTPARQIQLGLRFTF